MALASEKIESGDSTLVVEASTRLPRVVRRIGIVSRWSLWVLGSLFFISLCGPCGLQRPGFLIILTDGAFVYQDQHIPLRTKTPPKRLSWYKHGYYATEDPVRLSFDSRGIRWTQLIVPIWVPAIMSAIGTLVGRRRIGRIPGPARLTLKRYVAGLAEYSIALVSVTAIGWFMVFHTHAPYQIQGYFAVFVGLSWLAFPMGAWVSARRQINSANMKAPRGLCWDCGYDLTGNITGICSECGTPIHPDQRPPGIEALKAEN